MQTSDRVVACEEKEGSVRGEMQSDIKRVSVGYLYNKRTHIT